MAGAACVALAGYVLVEAGRAALVLSPLLLAAGIACFVVWWVRQRAEKYDLNRLWEEPLPAADEPYHDTIDPNTVGAPYCGWCDEAYPPGTTSCLHCGRALG